MLAGADPTCIIDATDGADVSIDAAQFDNAIVLGTAVIGNLIVVGDADAFTLNIQDGATVTSLDFDGGAGTERVRIGQNVSIGDVALAGAGGDDQFVILSGTQTGAVSFNGGDGDDALLIEGNVGSALAVDGGDGDDSIVVQNGGVVAGDISGSLGEGDDSFTVDGATSAIGNALLALGDGDNRFTLLGGGSADAGGVGTLQITAGDGDDIVRLDGGDAESDIAGSVELALGDGENFVNMTGLVEVDGDMTVSVGSGFDRIFSDETAVSGDQTLNLGDNDGTGSTVGSGGEALADIVVFGDDTVTGDSRVNAAGRFGLFEAGTRTVGGRFAVTQTADGSRAYLRVDQGSVFATGFDLTTLDQTTAYGLFTLSAGGLSLDTGDGADKLVLLDGTLIQGDATLMFGDADDDATDRLQIGSVEITGDLDAAFGDGIDRIIFEALTVGGDESLDLGEGFDQLELGDDDIAGSSTIEGTGPVQIIENGSRTIGDNLTIDIASDADSDGQDDPAQRVELLGASAVGGGMTIELDGRAVLSLDTTVSGGPVVVTTGSLGDRVDLSGLAVQSGNDLTVSTGGGDDTVSVAGATVTGNADIDLGDGDDELDNDAFTVDGDATLAGGDGNDTVSDDSQGTQTGFES